MTNYHIFTLIFFALLFDRLNIFLFLVISSFLHEAGHIIACYAMGYKPRITLSVFGAKLSNYPNEKYKKLIVLLCGPLVNLTAIIISYLYIQYTFSLNLYIFICVNVVIFAFNMLPVYFLDGGQILHLYVQNTAINKITDLFSFIILTVISLIFTRNPIHTTIAISFFIIYYIYNKTG